MLGKLYEVAAGDTRNWFLWLLHAVMPVSLSPAFLMRECMGGCPILLERESRWAIAVSIAAFFSGFFFFVVFYVSIFPLSFVACLVTHPILGSVTLVLPAFGVWLLGVLFPLFSCFFSFLDKMFGLNIYVHVALFPAGTLDVDIVRYIKS